MITNKTKPYEKGNFETARRRGDAYIDWLKSKNCRFYAPMDAEHGLSELIQGWTPNINQNTGFSCEWQQSQQAYMLDSSETYKCALMYNGGTINSGYVNKVIPSIGLAYVFDMYMTNDKTMYETPLGEAARTISG